MSEDDNLDDDFEIEVEEMETSEDPKEESESTEEATNEETSEESQETEDDGQAEESEDDESESNSEESQEESPEEAQKRHNAEMAQQRIAQREAERLAKLQDDQQSYIADADTDADRLVREIEVERYANKVKANEGTILTEFERVKADPSLQIFNPESKEFRPDLYGELTDVFDKAYTSYDQYGNIIEVKGSLYQTAKKWGQLWSKEAIVNQAKGQKVARQTSSKAEVTGASAAKPPKTNDPLMDLLMSDD
jgi:hypothetical protein